MFPKDVEDTRIKINSAFGSISYGLGDAHKAANLSGDPNLIHRIEMMYSTTFIAMREVGKLLEMEGWKPPKE
ncbi:MAG: hypothetical protein WC891_08745 [Actinomycetota bacterium]